MHYLLNEFKNNLPFARTPLHFGSHRPSQTNPQALHRVKGRLKAISQGPLPIKLAP